MGLDIRISRAKPICCSHCGELVTYKPIESIDSSGRQWYEFLEYVKYYGPKHDMYGKDMILNKEQVNELIKFLDRNPEVYMAKSIYNMDESDRIDNDVMIINADW